MMRFVYLFNAIVIGFSAWSELLHQRKLITEGKPWDLIYGVAFSLYAAYALLFLFGVRFPLRMLPLLLLQILYKLIWLIAVGYPLWSAGRLNPAATGAIKFFASIVALDLVIIPWPYVFEKYARALFRLEGTRGSPSKTQTGAGASIAG
jgi:hypothetical protein